MPSCGRVLGPKVTSLFAGGARMRNGGIRGGFERPVSVIVGQQDVLTKYSHRQGINHLAQRVVSRDHTPWRGMV